MNFFKSWYGDRNMLLSLSFLSTLFVFLNTLYNPYLSGTEQKPLQLFLCLLLLLSVATVLIAYTVYKLENISLEFSDSRRRNIIQTTLLYFVLPLVCILIFMGLNKRGLTLNEMLKDAVLTMFSQPIWITIVGVQRYLTIRKKEKYIHQLKKEKNHKKIRINEVLQKAKAIKIKYENILYDFQIKSRILNEISADEKRWRSYLFMCQVRLDATWQNESVVITPIDIKRCFLEEHNRSLRNISAELVDGRVVMLDFISLKNFKKRFQYLFFYSSRDELISYHSVANLSKERGLYYVHIKGKELEVKVISKNFYNIVKDRWEWFTTISKKRP